MPRGDDYRIKAADMQAKARDEQNPELRQAFEVLVMGYLRLADQADRNERYVLPGQTHVTHPTLQQQQRQPPKKTDADE